eukprot:15366616-Ditylum_brightwellii.AAC.3
MDRLKLLLQMSGDHNQQEWVYNGKCVVDLEFSYKQNKCLIESSQTDRLNNKYELLLNNEATSVQQMLGWGMHSFQGSFPRMKEHFKFEQNGEQQLMLHLVVLLYNARSELEYTWPFTTTTVTV